MTQGEKVIATNRKARHEYHIDDQLEVGLVLTGTEVKSLRAGQANLREAYCTVDGNNMILRKCHIAPYDHGNVNNHEPLRPRRILMHRREIAKWSKALQQKGYTIVPLKMYFKNGYAKLLIGLGKGKKLYDKRHSIAERDTAMRLKKVNTQRSRE